MKYFLLLVALAAAPVAMIAAPAVLTPTLTTNFGATASQTNTATSVKATLLGLSTVSDTVTNTTPIPLTFSWSASGTLYKGHTSAAGTTSQTWTTTGHLVASTDGSINPLTGRKAVRAAAQRWVVQTITNPTSATAGLVSNGDLVAVHDTATVAGFPLIGEYSEDGTTLFYVTSELFDLGTGDFISYIVMANRSSETAQVLMTDGSYFQLPPASTQLAIIDFVGPKVEEIAHSYSVTFGLPQPSGGGSGGNGGSSGGTGGSSGGSGGNGGLLGGNGSGGSTGGLTPSPQPQLGRTTGGSGGGHLGGGIGGPIGLGGGIAVGGNGGANPASSRTVVVTGHLWTAAIP
jgi:hypothetical protein